jgi:hypothetical protein
MFGTSVSKFEYKKLPPQKSGSSIYFDFEMAYGKNGTNGGEHMATYQIYEFSARAVMSYAAEQDGVYTFTLNRSATEHCKVPGAKHEQDSCAMFHQLMYQLNGKGWRERGEEKVTAFLHPSGFV